jgi:hypothetical protein
MDGELATLEERQASCPASDGREPPPTLPTEAGGLPLPLPESPRPAAEALALLGEALGALLSALPPAWEAAVWAGAVQARSGLDRSEAAGRSLGPGPCGYVTLVGEGVLRDAGEALSWVLIGAAPARRAKVRALLRSWLPRL